MKAATPAASGHSKRTGLWFRMDGQGPNLVLVSGLNGQARFWDACRDRLAREYRVLTFDQHGCGASPDDEADWTIETLADEALDLANEAFGNEPYAVIGHSTGGAIAQCMLARQPERAVACILSATWDEAGDYMRTLFELRLSLIERAPDLDAILGHLLRVVPDAFTPRDEAVALNPDVTRRRITALLGHNGVAYLAGMTRPALVIGAADDRIVPEHVLRRVHVRAAGSDLALLERGGHFFPQTQTEAFLGHVTQWLGKQISRSD